MGRPFFPPFGALLTEKGPLFLLEHFGPGGRRRLPPAAASCPAETRNVSQCSFGLAGQRRTGLDRRGVRNGCSGRNRRGRNRHSADEGTHERKEQARLGGKALCSGERGGFFSGGAAPAARRDGFPLPAGGVLEKPGNPAAGSLFLYTCHKLFYIKQHKRMFDGIPLCWFWLFSRFLPQIFSFFLHSLFYFGDCVSGKCDV